MKRLLFLTLFLLLIRGSEAFNGSSSSYTMTHSNLNYGTHYSDGCVDDVAITCDGVCNVGELCSVGWETCNDCQDYSTPDCEQICFQKIGFTYACIGGGGIDQVPLGQTCSAYTIDYSLVEQPVGSGVSGNYTYSLGFYFGEAQDYFQRLMKDVNGVYPLMLLVMMLYVGSRISKKNGNEKEIQEASMAQ